jgi:hypothetical protein
MEMGDDVDFMVIQTHTMVDCCHFRPFGAKLDSFLGFTECFFAVGRLGEVE